MKKVIKKQKKGRPIKSENERLSEYICLKLKPDQYRYLVKAAKDLHTTPASYVRTRLFPS